MAFCVLHLVILIMERGIFKKVKQHWISWISWMRFLEVWLLFEVGGSQDQSHSPGKSRLHDGHHIRTPGDSSNARIKLDEHGWKPLNHTTIYDIIILNLYSDNLKAQTDCNQKAQRTKPGFTPLTLTEILEDFRASAGKLRPLLVNFIDTWWILRWYTRLKKASQHVGLWTPNELQTNQKTKKTSKKCSNTTEACFAAP